MINERDNMMMRRALQLARKGRGFVSPNPMVGAVIVGADGIVIGEGRHRLYGCAHAEVNAVNSVADRSLLRGSTIFVTLEPCSHYGKTPPCALLLRECGFERVVIGSVDPNPRVAGRGIALLREAGITVDVGALEGECCALNRAFFHAHTTRRAWSVLKWAQSFNGVMAAQEGSPRLKLSSPLSTVMMHRERAAVDAIMVGAATVRADNPSLTVRHAECRRQPLRVVVASSPASLPPRSALLADGAPTVVLNGLLDDVRGEVEWVKTDLADPFCWLELLFQRYACISVMVEGGISLLSQFIKTSAWNEARVETVPWSAVGRGAPEIYGSKTSQIVLHDNTVIETVLNNEVAENAKKV